MCICLVPVVWAELDSWWGLLQGISQVHWAIHLRTLLHGGNNPVSTRYYFRLQITMSKKESYNFKVCYKCRFGDLRKGGVTCKLCFKRWHVQCTDIQVSSPAEKTVLQTLYWCLQCTGGRDGGKPFDYWRGLRRLAVLFRSKWISMS